MKVYRTEEELDPGSSLEERIVNTIIRLACQPKYADRLLYWGGVEFFPESNEEIINLFMIDADHNRSSRIGIFSVTILDPQNIGDFVLKMRLEMKPIQEHHYRLNHAAEMAPIMEVNDGKKD